MGDSQMAVANLFSKIKNIVLLVISFANHHGVAMFYLEKA